MAYAGQDFQNETASYLAEYNYRRALADIGFGDSFKNLSSYKADIFRIIASQIAECDQEKLKKK